jgi:hypothetical protein
LSESSPSIRLSRSGQGQKARRSLLQLQLMSAASHTQLSANVAPNVHSRVVAEEKRFR